MCGIALSRGITAELKTEPASFSITYETFYSNDVVKGVEATIISSSPPTRTWCLSLKPVILCCKILACEEAIQASLYFLWHGHGYVSCLQSIKDSVLCENEKCSTVWRVISCDVGYSTYAITVFRVRLQIWH